MVVISRSLFIHRREDEDHVLRPRRQSGLRPAHSGQWKRLASEHCGLPVRGGFTVCQGREPGSRACRVHCRGRGTHHVADARQIGSFVTVRLAAVGPSTPLPHPTSWRTPARRAGTRADDKLQNHLIDSWLQPCGLGFSAASAGAGGAGHKLVASIRNALLYVSPFRARFNLQQLWWLGAIDAAPRSPKYRTTPCDQQKLLDLASDIGHHRPPDARRRRLQGCRPHGR